MDFVSGRDLQHLGVSEVRRPQDLEDKWCYWQNFDSYKVTQPDCVYVQRIRQECPQWVQRKVTVARRSIMLSKWCADRAGVQSGTDRWGSRTAMRWEYHQQWDAAEKQTHGVWQCLLLHGSSFLCRVESGNAWPACCITCIYSQQTYVCVGFFALLFVCNNMLHLCLRIYICEHATHVHFVSSKLATLHSIHWLYHDEARTQCLVGRPGNAGHVAFIGEKRKDSHKATLAVLWL